MNDVDTGALDLANVELNTFTGRDGVILALSRRRCQSYFLHGVCGVKKPAGLAPSAPSSSTLPRLRRISEPEQGCHISHRPH